MPEKLIRAPGAGVLHRAERAPPDGATRLQSPVLLVRGARGGQPVWVPTVFTHNRERFLEAGFVHKVFAEVLA